MTRWRDYLLDALNLLFFAAILLVKTYYVKFSLAGSAGLNRSFWFGTLGTVLLITALLLLFKPRARFWAFLGINLFISLTLIIDILYGRYFNDITSVALLKQAKLAAGVQASVIALLQPRDLAYFIDFFILLPGLWFARRQPQQKRQHFGWLSRLALLLICALSGSSLIQASVASLQERQPGLIRALWDKQVVAHNIGTLNYHALDIWRHAKRRLTTKKLPDDEVQAVAAWLEQQTNKGTKHHKSMEGKNLIMVQLEAFQGFVLNLQLDGQEVTPNLNRLAAAGMNFTNAYYQTAMGGTSDAEFLANVSFYPAQGGTAFYEYADNTFHSLPLAARDKGYTSVVMHPFRPGFWNRPPMYDALGFDSYLHQYDFELDDIYGMGLSDHSFYRQAVERMTQMEQPFYYFLISLSSHFPFLDVNVDLTERLDVGYMAGTFMGNYLQNIHYADEAVGLLVDELKQADLWDNSIVLFYGDHHAIPASNSQELAQLLYGKDTLDKLEWQQAQTIVMVMHLPGDKYQATNDMAVGQIDIFPTMANLLGFDCPYALGQDIFNIDSGFVCFRDGLWLNDDVVYWRAANEIRDVHNGAVLEVSDYQDAIDKATEQLYMSDLTLEHNLMKYWLTGASE